MARTPSPVAPACDQPVPARPSADGTPAHKGGACSWIVASLTSWTPKLKQMGVHETGSTSACRLAVTSLECEVLKTSQDWAPTGAPFLVARRRMARRKAPA